MTTALPSGSVIVPPVPDATVWLVEAIVPATTTGKEALLLGSSVLVAEMVTVNGVGRLDGAV